jgi:membrane-associated protein
MPPFTHATSSPALRALRTTGQRSLTSIHHFGARFIVTPLSIFMAWLTVHTHLAYLVLFLGAYFETLIGPSLVIPGELFLLSGSILAGTGVLDIWLVVISLYAGAILGDSSSYFIGRAIGPSIFHERKKILNLKHYKRAESTLQKYGPATIFFARLIGPFSKIAPVLAGIFDIPLNTFLMYNIPGVIIGCGEFIVAGYYFGNRYALVLWIFERYFILLTLVVIGLLVARWYLKTHPGTKNQPHKIKNQ